MKCGMGVSDALTLWKWRITFVVEWTLLLENRMESLFTERVARLIVTSCDVESIDEFVCEMKWSADSALFSWSPPITRVWERDHANLLFLGFLISFHSTSLLYHLHRLAFEFHNCNHHHSLSFSSNCNPYSIHLLITINSTHSNSSQWSLFNRITLFRHLFPFYSPCNDPLWWITPHQNQSFNSWAKQSSSTLYSLSLFYPHNQILSTGSRTRDRTLIHHLLSNGKNPYHTQLLLLKQTSPITLNPSTNQIRVKVATLQQLLVCSLSRYHTIVNHEDDIHNPAQTMCHHSRIIFSPRLQRRQELLLMLTVQRTRRLAQKEDRWITKTPNAASDLPTPPFPQLLDRYPIDQASRC